VVKDDHGATLPSQRLSTGELVFLARDLPPLGARRFAIQSGPAAAPAAAQAEGTTLRSTQFMVKLDSASGDIVSLRRTGGGECVAETGRLNQYVYLPGSNRADAKRSGPAKIRVKEAGPLVASLEAESAAPGCNKLLRTVRLVEGLDRIEIQNVVDKQAVRTVEGVHFRFDFLVPNCRVHMNIPWAVIEPEKDQLEGACKNWFSVERWVDVSNQHSGVTWATIDAPLVEVGDLTANLPRMQSNPKAYMDKIAPSSTLYSWAMNNHWFTNYRADQEGPVTLRYAVRPHEGYDPLAAARFGVEASVPLVVAPAAGLAPAGSRLTVEPAGVMVTSIKPSDDGKAWIVRLFAAGGQAQQARLTWAAPAPKAMYLSDLSEMPGSAVADTVSIPAWGVVTLRAERP
jgi:hypothetical protein